MHIQTKPNVCVQMRVQLRGRVPVPGEYVLVVEYASEDQFPQTFIVSVDSPGESTHLEEITLLRCKYRCVCVTLWHLPFLLSFRYSYSA